MIGVTVLGATGTIGLNTLDVLERAVLIRTFRKAPMTALRAQSAATPASETDASRPVFAIASAISIDAQATSIVRKGTSMAPTVASWTALALAAFSSSVASGRPKASMIRLKAFVSSSTRRSSSSWHALPLTAHSEVVGHAASYQGGWHL